MQIPMLPFYAKHKEQFCLATPEPTGPSKCIPMAKRRGIVGKLSNSVLLAVDRHRFMYYLCKYENENISAPC
jgi:hypothetical protein